MVICGFVLTAHIDILVRFLKVILKNGLELGQGSPRWTCVILRFCDTVYHFMENKPNCVNN